MPLESLEEEGLPKNLDLRIAQLRFLLSLPPRSPDPAAPDELMAAVRLHNMALYYEALCKSLEWQMDTELLNKMKKDNEEESECLDNKLEDAEKILGESEIQDAMMAKAKYLCSTGDKVIKGAEILEALHSLPAVQQYLFSLYKCCYSAFSQSLAVVEQEMKKDWLFAPHYQYYVQEMRIRAYSQLLESYRSLTLGYMPEAFGVSVEFIDQELSRFIAAGQLHCKIDNETVETNRPDSKTWQYQETIKKGDLLLNRVHKLSRVINM